MGIVSTMKWFTLNMTERNTTIMVLLSLCIPLVRIVAIFAYYMLTGTAVLNTAETDPLLYLGGARSILDCGLNVYPFFAPLNFFFIAGFLVLGQGNALAPVMATACVGWLAVVALYALARELFDTTTAAIAALLCGLYPNLVFYGLNLYPETLALFFITSSFVMLFKYFKAGRVTYLLIAGILWGLASQTRGGLHFFSLGICLAIIVRQRHQGLLCLVKPVSFLLVSVYMTVFVVALMAAPFHGSVPLNSKSGIGSALHGANRLINCNPDYGAVRGSIFYRINEVREPWPEGVQVYSDELVEQNTFRIMTVFVAFIMENPLSYLKNGFERLSFLWSPNQLIIKYLKTHFYYRQPAVVEAACLALSLLFILVVCGGILGFIVARDSFRPLFGCFVAFYCLLIFFTVGNAKLRLPLMPFFIMYCAYFIAQIISRRIVWKSVFFHPWVIMLIVLFCANGIYRYGEISLSPGEVIVRQIELSAELGFPETARFLLKSNRAFPNYSKEQRMRLEHIERQLFAEVKND